MSITLSQARQTLYKYVSPTLDTALVTSRINSALERIYNSGKWKGLMATVLFNLGVDPNQWWTHEDVSYITLSRRFQSVLGILFDSRPRLMYPRWQEYMAQGMGKLTSSSPMQQAVDMGDEYVTYNDPTSAYYLKIVYSYLDSGATITFSATDSNNSPIYDPTGNSVISVTLPTIGSGTGSYQYPTQITKLVSFQKPITEAYLNLWAVNPSNSAQSCQISAYEPTETTPLYKRYRTPAAQYVQQILAMCKRRFVPFVAGNDDNSVIMPSNEGALKMVLMALQYEDKNDLERAETYFQKAIQLLNAELKEDMGDPVITLQMNPNGGVGSVPCRY